MESINNNQEKITDVDKALADPKTPLGLVYTAMALYTTALLNAGIISDVKEVEQIQHSVFQDSLEVHIGKKQLRVVREVEGNE